MDRLQAKYTNEHSRFIVIDDTLVHYRDEGNGPPLLLLHGAFSSLHTFDAWTQQLRSRFRIIRLDLMGFGLTGPNPINDYSMRRHVRCIVQLLNRLKIQNCHVAGSSLGGWIGWEFALAYPERVRKLVLVAAAGFLDESSIPLPFKLARAPVLNHAIRYVVKRSVLEQFVRQVYYDPGHVTPELIDRYYDLFSQPGNTRAFLHLANSRVRDNTWHLRELRTPTLILWGMQDRWLPVENAYRFRDRLPKAEVVLYNGVGHLPMEERPVRSSAEMAAFLQRPEATTAPNGSIHPAT